MSFWETLSQIVRIILIMSVTGSVVSLLLFALMPIIKSHLPKSIQYYLWVIVLTAFFVPLSVFVSLPLNTPLTPIQQIIETNVKSTGEWQEQLAMELYGMPYAELNDAEQVNISYREFKVHNVGNYNFLISFILISGATYFLKELFLYTAYASKLRRGRLPARKNEQELLPNRSPRLYRNTFASTPMLLGVFYPVIYLPDREYSKQQLQNILCHELTHLRRHDLLIKWIAAIVVSVHWFNPVVYLVRKEIDRFCELACDEAVIKNLDAKGKQIYGDTLIEMAATTKQSRGIVSTTMCEEKRTLKERLSAIMKSKGFNLKMLLFSCMLLVVVICVTVLLGASSNRNEGNDIGAITQEELLSIMKENTPPEGLTLEIISAMHDDAEFLLINATDNIVEYGYANRVERYINGGWEATLSETKTIFPENPEPLQAGQRMYGNAAWVRDNTELEPGTYRYLLLVNVRNGDLPVYPVVLEAPFEIAK